jgi:hypothetical protein
MSETNTVPPPPPIIKSQTSEKAIISLVCGIAGCLFVPFIAGILAVIFGGQAEKEIRESGDRLTGLGLAKAGGVLGWINILFWGFLGCLTIAPLVGMISSGLK